MEQEASFTTVLINFGKIWLHPQVAKPVRFSTTLLSLQLGIIVLAFSRLPPQIPLFFSRPWGESQLAPPSSLFLLPLFSFAILLLNTSLAAFLIEKNNFLASVLSLGSAVFSLFGLIALLKIIALVL